MNVFVQLAGFLVISGVVHADWSDYKAVPLSEAWAQAGVIPDRSVDTYIGAPQLFKFSAKTVYTGPIRHCGASVGFDRQLGASDGTTEFTDRF